MADLSIDFCGIKSPNPFWLASAPPANGGEQVMRAFDAGWGGAVWKTLGNPIVNVSSRFGGLDYNGTKVAGFNNIELITDRPLETNLREIAAVKKRYPKHAVIASLLQVRHLVKRVDAGIGPARALELEPPPSGRIANRPLDLALNGARVLLLLPAAVSRAGVLERHLVAGHSADHTRGATYDRSGWWPASPPMPPV